jgi:hypothetical protein
MTGETSRVDDEDHHLAMDEEDPAEIGSRGHPQPRKRLRLRRSPLGARAVDVRDQLEAFRAELDDRRDDIDELRNDVAALWLAFGQHERAIRDLIAAVEALGGARVTWPGERGEGQQLPIQTETLPGLPTTRLEPPGNALDRETIAAQLAGLDDVLAAIDQATRSLENVYSEETADASPPATRERS